MGLLDQFSNLNEDQTQGLLAAAAQVLQQSGPSRTPASFGQIVGGGMGAYQDSTLAARKRKLDEQQAAEIAQMRKLQNAREQQKFDMQKSVMDEFGGAPTAGQPAMAVPAGAPPDTPFGFTPPAPVASPTRGESSKLNQYRRMAILGVPGAKELFDIHKYESEPQKLESGATYVDRSTGSERYMPKMDSGFTMGPGGASLVPGYADGVASLEGGKADAVERARAKYNTTTLDLPGGPRMVSTADLPKIMGGGGGDWGGINDKYKAGQPQRTDGRLAILTDELARERDPRNRAMLEREIRSIGGGQRAGGPGIALQDPIEKERTLTEMRAATEVDKAGKLATQTSQMAASKLHKQLQSVIPAARALLETGPTGSGVGAAADSALGFFGRATDSGKAADQLETIAGWMAANVPRMEGPQSNVDVQNYRIMAANVGDRTKPAAARLAALKSMEELTNRYAEGGGVNTAQPAAPAPTPSSKSVTLSDIAATAKASGRSTAEVTAALKAKGYKIGGQ